LNESCAQKGNAMTVYGYARVSSDTQPLAAQDAELHKTGAVKVYREKISGADRGRERRQFLDVARVVLDDNGRSVTRRSRPSPDMRSKQ
jgi:hypothetical protein